jgi:hypothetical protein
MLTDIKIIKKLEAQGYVRGWINKDLIFVKEPKSRFLFNELKRKFVYVPKSDEIVFWSNHLSVFKYATQ